MIAKVNSDFMFMGPCILVYNNHININEMQLFCSLFDGKTLRVSSVTRSSSGVQETVFAIEYNTWLQTQFPELLATNTVS